APSAFPESPLPASRPPRMPEPVRRPDAWATDAPNSRTHTSRSGSARTPASPAIDPLWLVARHLADTRPLVPGGWPDNAQWYGTPTARDPHPAGRGLWRWGSPHGTRPC